MNTLSFLILFSAWATGFDLEPAIDIPRDAKVSGGWQRNPLHKRMEFRHGYFKWCDDPDCWLCGEYVYKGVNHGEPIRIEKR